MTATATAPNPTEAAPISRPAETPDAWARAWVAVSTIVLAVIIALLVLPLAAGAVLSAAGWLALPYELAVVDARLPGLFRIHMASAASALVLVPVAILTRRRPALHRIAGRTAAITILLAGMTAVPVALASVASAWAVAGFIVQALTWLTFLCLGYVAIRRRKVQSHARAMIAVTAVTSAAIWLRPAMVLARHADWPFETTYAVIVWASWLVPLAVVAVGMRSVRGRGFATTSPPAEPPAHPWRGVRAASAEPGAGAPGRRGGWPGASEG